MALALDGYGFAIRVALEGDAPSGTQFADDTEALHGTNRKISHLSQVATKIPASIGNTTPQINFFILRLHLFILSEVTQGPFDYSRAPDAAFATDRVYDFDGINGESERSVLAFC